VGYFPVTAGQAWFFLRKNPMKTEASDWCVYLIQCADQSLYTGITTDITRRLRQHNGEIKGGARYTLARRPVVLLWVESHASRAEASRREYQIKQLPRGAKLQLVLNQTGR